MKHHIMHNDGGSWSSCSTSHDCSHSASCVRLPGSRSLSRLAENHHINDQGKVSPCQIKTAHSYSDSKDPVQDGDSIYTTFATPEIKKSKKARCKTA
jgi:hypothetical protein